MIERTNNDIEYELGGHLKVAILEFGIFVIILFSIDLVWTQFNWYDKTGRNLFEVTRLLFLIAKRFRCLVFCVIQDKICPYPVQANRYFVSNKMSLCICRDGWLKSSSKWMNNVVVDKVNVCIHVTLPEYIILSRRLPLTPYNHVLNSKCQFNVFLSCFLPLFKHRIASVWLTLALASNTG